MNLTRWCVSIITAIALANGLSGGALIAPTGAVGMTPLSRLPVKPLTAEQLRTYVPGGATARCRDGEFSFSLHHRPGACGAHGGVIAWLDAPSRVSTASRPRRPLRR